MKSIQITYTGRKAKIGSICFDDRDRMCTFVGYCPDCQGKITMSFDEARSFATKFGSEANDPMGKLFRIFVRRRKLA